jgi:hypothetical protein
MRLCKSKERWTHSYWRQWFSKGRSRLIFWRIFLYFRRIFYIVTHFLFLTHFFIFDAFFYFWRIFLFLTHFYIVTHFLFLMHFLFLTHFFRSTSPWSTWMTWTLIIPALERWVHQSPRQDCVAIHTGESWGLKFTKFTQTSIMRINL